MRAFDARSPQRNMPQRQVVPDARERRPFIRRMFLSANRHPLRRNMR